MNRPVCLLFFGLAGAILLLSLSPTLFAQTYAYIPSLEDQSVVRVDTATQATRSISLDCGPYGAAVMPQGSYVLVTCSDSDQLTKITNANFSGSGTPLSNLVDSGPRGVAVDPTGTYAYVACFNDNTVWEIQLSTFGVSATIDVGLEPWAVAAHFDEATEETIAYVANSGDGTISVIRDGVLSDTVSVGSQPIGLALAPDGSRLYVADNGGFSGSLIIVRTNDLTIIERIEDVNLDPLWGLAMGSDGEYLYITRNQAHTDNTSGMVSLFFTADNSMVDLAVDALDLTGIAAPKNGDFAYAVSHQDNSVFKITASTLTVESLDGIGIDGAYALGTFIGGTPPSAPSALSATVDSYDEITLDWTDNATDELGFKIERRVEEDAAYVQIAKMEADTTTFTDTGLDEQTTYEYRIRSYNEAADSGYATLAQAVTTLEGLFSWCFIDTLFKEAP